MNTGTGPRVMIAWIATAVTADGLSIWAGVTEEGAGRFRIDVGVGPGSTWNGLDFARTLGDGVTSADRFLKAVLALSGALVADGLGATLPDEVGRLILTVKTDRQERQVPAGGIESSPTS